MRTIYYKNFRIHYAPNQINTVHRILEMVDKNPFLLKEVFTNKISLFGKEKGYTTIDSFSKNWSDFGKKIYEKRDQFQKIDHIVDSLYYYILLYHYDTKKQYEKMSDKLDKNYLYTIAAILYYESEKDFLHFAEFPTKSEKRKIAKFLYEHQTESVYKKVYQNYYRRLGEVTEDNLEELLEENRKVREQYQERKIPFSPVDLSQIDLLIKKYLIYIDSTGKLCESYINKKQKKKIQFYSSSKEDNELSYTYEKDGYLFIFLNHNIYDFITVVSALVSYLEKEKTESTPLEDSLLRNYWIECAISFLEENEWPNHEVKEIQQIELKRQIKTFNWVEDILESMIYEDESQDLPYLIENTNEIIGILSELLGRHLAKKIIINRSCREDIMKWLESDNKKTIKEVVEKIIYFNGVSQKNHKIVL